MIDKDEEAVAAYEEQQKHNAKVKKIATIRRIEQQLEKAKKEAGLE